MRMPSWVDPIVAAAIAAAAAVEAIAVSADDAPALALRLIGAGSLAILALRRRRPLLVLVSVAAAAWIAGTLPALLRSDAAVGAGAPVVGLMLAAYSLGTHARLPRAAWGAPVALAFALAVDLPLLRGWPLVSGVAFLTLIAGLLPLGAGMLVRARRARLHLLHEQEERIDAQRREEHESAVLAERLRIAERLRTSVLDGLTSLAEKAESGADPATIEANARDLLTRTRAEVVAFSTPIESPPDIPRRPAETLHARRALAQPWTVIGAGVIAAGVALETVEVLAPGIPIWTALLTGLAIGAPLALTWRYPLAAIVISWSAVTLCSRLVVPLDHSLSGTAIAVVTPFAIAALSSKRIAALGLLVCGLGQIMGIGTDDPLGEAEVMLASWLGGLAVGEASRLVEQTRANSAVLAAEAAVERQRFVVALRLRIAQDLHDAVGHALAIVALQAGAARRLAVMDPIRVPAVLDTIADVARDGIKTMMTDDRDGSEVMTVIERTRAAGLEVTSDLTAAARLDAEQIAVVAWVVREALANVARHAGRSRVTVASRQEGDEVLIAISNSASAGSRDSAGSGRGLPGIARRVAAIGGTAHWGPVADGGFEVRVRLPLPIRAGVAG